MVRRHVVVPAVAGAVTVGLVVLGMMIRAVAPFGPKGRSIGDLGGQFVPFHAHLWDLLRGDVPGGWEWTWQSGLGAPFVPDLATYLGNPLALTVALWPRDQIETAVLAVTLMTYALAAAAMSTYLLRLRPHGHPALASLLGVAYATCGWALDDGSYVPMWLTGLVGLPLIALVGEWARARVHAFLAPWIVALVWIANFYTAYMATLGAALLILAQVLLSERSWRTRVADLALAARHVVLGIAISAIALLPTFSAVRRGQPSPTTPPSFASTRDLVGRLLPLSEGVGLTPGLYVGTAVILLALTLPWNSRVPARVRVVWLGLVGLLLTSLQLPITQAIWHGFDTPNGSGYRQAFVVCGAVVVMAWVAAEASPGRAATFGGAACTGLILAIGHGASGITRWSIPLALATLTVTTVWLLLRASTHGSRLVGRALGVALIGVVLFESLATWVITDDVRESRFGVPHAWGPADTRLLELGSESRGAANGRVEFADSASANSPLLYGYSGLRYYSSTMAESTSRALRTLGVPWSGSGRAIGYRSDPGLDPLISTTTVPVVDGLADTAVRPPALSARTLGDHPPEWTDDPWSARNTLAGVAAYTAPTVSVTIRGRTTVLPPEGLRRNVAAGTEVSLTATCPAGTTTQFWAPSQAGTIVSNGSEYPLLPSGTGNAGTRVSAGVLTIATPQQPSRQMTLEPGPRVALPGRPIGCLDQDVLSTALAVGGGTVELLDDGMAVDWPKEQSGTVALPSTFVEGWQCVAPDGSDRAVVPVAGMLGVKVSGDAHLSCTYVTPGLRAGGIVSAAAASCAVLLALWGRRRRRRGPRSPAPSPAPTVGLPTATP